MEEQMYTIVRTGFRARPSTVDFHTNRMAKHNLIGAIRNAFLPKGGGQIFSTRFAIQQKYRAKSSLISAKILRLDKKSLRLDKNPHFYDGLCYTIVVVRKE